MYCKRGWVCAVNNNDDDREVEALQELLAPADAVSFFRTGEFIMKFTACKMSET